MNYLAHLFLSKPDPSAVVGNLLGDFVLGLDLQAFPLAVRQGIELHRTLDRFTDAHPDFLASRRRISPPCRRFSGVLIDVFYDHFLAKHWSRFSPTEPLLEFSQRIYSILAAEEAWLPLRLRRMLPVMIAENWLVAYGDCEHVALTLSRMAARLRRPTTLAQGIHDLHRSYAELQEDFLRFFPQVTQWISTAR